MRTSPQQAVYDKWKRSATPSSGSFGDSEYSDEYTESDSGSLTPCSSSSSVSVNTYDSRGLSLGTWDFLKVIEKLGYASSDETDEEGESSDDDEEGNSDKSDNDDKGDDDCNKGGDSKGNCSKGNDGKGDASGVMATKAMVARVMVMAMTRVMVMAMHHQLK